MDPLMGSPPASRSQWSLQYSILLEYGGVIMSLSMMARRFWAFSFAFRRVSALVLLSRLSLGWLGTLKESEELGKHLHQGAWQTFVPAATGGGARALCGAAVAALALCELPALFRFVPFSRTIAPPGPATYFVLGVL